MEVLLEVKNLEVAYKKNIKVLHELKLILYQNTICGLVGKNGSGKTTLLKTLSSVFNKDIYQLERFIFLDRNLEFNSELYKQNKYTVFAESESFLNWTFEKYVEMVCDLYKLPMDRTRLSELVTGFKFEKYCQKEIRELSTGNKKKVFLIVGLYLRRPLLMLDEPFDGLDFEATEYLYKQLREYRKYGTVFMSTHFAESIVRVCDHLYILDQGSIALFQGDLSKWLKCLQTERDSNDLESHM